MELVIDQPFDLKSSLESGQAHRWKKVDGWYSGVVRGELIQIRQKGQVVEFSSGPSPEASMAAMLRDYFRLDDDINAIYSEINRDRRVAEMVTKYPGLRILRTEPWECLVAFICSANNNIARIHQLMERMSDEFGNPILLNGQTRHTFPVPPTWRRPAKQNCGGWDSVSGRPTWTTRPGPYWKGSWTCRRWCGCPTRRPRRR